MNIAANFFNFNKRDASQMMQWAHHIIALYPRSHIFALGNTPSHIIKTIGLINTLEQDEPENIGYIPFSGDFYEWTTEGCGWAAQIDVAFKHAFGLDRNPHSLMPNTTRYVPRLDISPDTIKQYRDLLKSIGISPQAIIDRYEQGHSTTIVEYIITGNGLASFLSILRNWAKEQSCETALRRALNIHLLVRPKTRLKNIQLDNDQPIPCTRQIIDTELMESFNRWTDGRIVPQCDLQAGVTDLTGFKTNPLMAELMTNLLSDAIISKSPKRSVQALQWLRRLAKGQPTA